MDHNGNIEAVRVWTTTLDIGASWDALTQLGAAARDATSRIDYGWLRIFPAWKIKRRETEIFTAVVGRYWLSFLVVFSSMSHRMRHFISLL